MTTTLRVKASAASITFRTPGFSSSAAPAPHASPQALRRPRGNSISKRLRSASDLEENGVITRTQKTALKDLLISGDRDVVGALDAHDDGDDAPIASLLTSEALNRRASLDLFEGLDLDDLNMNLSPASAGGPFDLAPQVILGSGAEALDLAPIPLPFSDDDVPSRRNSLAIPQSPADSPPLPTFFPGNAFPLGSFDELEWVDEMLEFNTQPLTAQDPHALGSRVRLRSMSRGSFDFGSRPVRLKRDHAGGSPLTVRLKRTLRDPSQMSLGEGGACAAPLGRGAEAASAGHPARLHVPASGTKVVRLVKTPARRKTAKAAGKASPVSAPGALQLGGGKRTVPVIPGSARSGSPGEGEGRRRPRQKASYVMANLTGTPQLMRAFRSLPPGAKSVKMSTLKGVKGARLIQRTPKKSGAHGKSTEPASNEDLQSGPEMSVSPVARGETGAQASKDRQRRVEKYQGKLKRQDGVGGKKVKVDLRTQQVRFATREDEESLKDIIAEEFDLDFEDALALSDAEP